jgi:hypothetical protein
MNALHMLLKGKKRGKSYKIYNPMHLHLINMWATTGVMSVPNKFFWQEKGQILILAPNSLGSNSRPYHVC